MDRGRVMGLGRWGLVAGVLVVGLGGLGNVPKMMWAGVVLSGIALATNAAAKCSLYAGLPIPASKRVAVIGAWLLVVLSIETLLVDYTLSVVSTDYDGFFWALVVGSAGFAAVYQGLRSKFVPESREITPEG